MYICRTVYIVQYIVVQYTKRVKTTHGDPALPKRDSHLHSASMSTTIEPPTPPCDTLDYTNDQALVSKRVTYMKQTTEASPSMINGTAPRSKETSCCNRYKSKLQNGQRSNNRLNTKKVKSDAAS